MEGHARVAARGPVSLTRRSFCVGAAAGVVTALMSRTVLERVARAASNHGPRYWLQIIPGGGIDAVYTTDPRTTKSVKSGVDVPYKPNEIVEAKGMQLGPHFKALAPWSSKLAIINGVRVYTANHHTGMQQLARLRTRVTSRSQSAFEILGAHRQGQAVGAVSLGISPHTAFTPHFLGTPAPMIYGSKIDMFTVLDTMTPEDLDLAARTMERHAASARRSGIGSVGDRAGLTSLEDGAQLFRRLIDVPRYERVAWPEAEGDNQSGHAENFQRALWLIENDLASSVAVQSFAVWDTHYDNAKRQTVLNPVLARNLGRLFAELEKRSNKYGKLSDQTAVMVVSELGRFPYLNASLGKDHYPQAPVLFYGKWFNTGTVYGDTDKELKSLPISLATGRGHRTGKLVSLDDVGATLLRLGGLDPEVYGFDGNRLDFLVKA